MRKLLILILSVMLALSCFVFVACGKDKNPPQASQSVSESKPTQASQSVSESSSSQNSQSSAAPLPSITGFTLSDKSFDFDGQAHSLSVEGNTNGFNVTYAGNGKVDAGTHTVTATIKKDGYKDLVLTAKLTINKIALSGITFDDKTVEYDTLAHTVAIVGNIPSDATVTYTCNGKPFTEATEVGEYVVNVKVTHKNYLDFESTATLKITATEELLHSAFIGGKVYFQNNLDDNKLYSCAWESSSNILLNKVSNDIPEYITESGNNLYYFSRSLLSKTLKQFAVSANKSTTLYQVKGEYLTNDGTYLYYAVNNILSTADNGIYKVAIDGSTTEPQKIADCKAKYLTYNSGKLYFANASEGNRLYSLSTSGGALTKLWDEKVEYIITDGSNLYFNSSNTVMGVSTASAVYKYNISNRTAIKLTTDSGKYLTKIGNWIYYVNNDLLTSNLFGDGIYKVSANLTSDSSLPGEKVLSCEDNGYSSLTSDGNYLYYYKLNDKHFYSYNISSMTEKDLMAGFVVTDDTTLLGYAKLAYYNGEIYYTNPREDSCLYKYNPTTRAKMKVLSDCISGVAFNDGYMYYSTFVATQYALWKMNLATNEVVKISTSRCDNLFFEGDYIYYVDVTSTWSNHIKRMKNDGTEVTEIYGDKNLWVSDMERVGNDFYFIINPAVGYKYIYKYSLDTNEGVSLDVKSQKSFTIGGNKIYFFNDNKLCSCNLDGSGVTQLASNVDINDMIFNNGKLYYSSTSSSAKGIFELNIQTEAQIKISSSNGDGFKVVDGKVYFIQTAIDYQNDYPMNTGEGDGRLYVINGTSVSKLA